MKMYKIKSKLFEKATRTTQSQHRTHSIRQRHMQYVRKERKRKSERDASKRKPKQHKDNENKTFEFKTYRTYYTLCSNKIRKDMNDLCFVFRIYYQCSSFVLSFFFRNVFVYSSSLPFCSVLVFYRLVVSDLR